MSGQPPNNAAGMGPSRPTVNGNSNGGMSIVSQQRSDQVGGNTAQNGGLSQQNLNNIVRLISLLNKSVICVSLQNLPAFYLC